MKPSTHDQASGLIKTITGQVKETTGDLVGNPKLEAAGKQEKLEGQVQKKVGEIEKVLGQ